MGIVSLISGIISIFLGAYAIWFAWKESKHSAENYNKTKELLAKIESKAELIDRSVQLQQTQLIAIINKALDKVGQSPIDIHPLSLEEIDQIISEKVEPTVQQLDNLKNVVQQIPKIHVSQEEPTELKNGDIWFKVE